MARHGRRGRGRGTVHRQQRSKALGERVRRVGPEHFGVLAVDSAKSRFAVLLSDFYGRVLMDMLEVDNTGPALEGLVATVKSQCEAHGLKDLVVAIEQTGRYHVPIRQVLRGHWDVQMVHPFATKQLRQPADPGNKTDPTDLQAIVRAIIVGYGTAEPELSPRWADWRLVSREREALVRRRAWVRVRLQMRLDALMPGYPALFGCLWSSPVPLALARRYGSAAALLSAGEEAILDCGRQAGSHVQRRTVARVLAWAAEAAPADPGAGTSHRLLGDQIELLSLLEAQIGRYERDLADYLVDTPFVLLLGIPGINIVSAASYGAELGPIEHYLHPTKITGRAGIYPSRYQSNETDLADGPLVGQRNARLRDAIFEVAHNLIYHNAYFKAWAELRHKRKWAKQKVHVAVACKFVRISYWMLAGRMAFQHPCVRGRDAILRKLLRFAKEKALAAHDARSLLLRAVRQLPGATHPEEARALMEELPRGTRRRRRGGVASIGEVLPEVIAELTHSLSTEPERSQAAPLHPAEDPSLSALER
ncbi:MAG TPA: transposase [Planctomycetota bacterium]|nr:transposase [Planctomycetota bacterium]